MKFVSRLTCANKQARVILVAVFSAGGLLGCSGLDNTIVDPVQWWAVNGWVGAVTIQLNDNNCIAF